jgi:pimeloyl-ACP methyl ester carboxylesterase
MFDFVRRIQELKAVFSYQEKVRLSSRISITPFCFRQTVGVQEVKAVQQALSVTGFCPLTDDCIPENTTFAYTVFAPGGQVRHDRAILLLHGLNERSWDKYLPWAEYLAEATGKAVVLFPLAFHMNRTPVQWCDPRAAMPLVRERRQHLPGLHNSTFANVVLSTRISQEPLRFYLSGLETWYNLVQLVREIKSGEHPFFSSGAAVNIFAYSVGALLSQVLLLANPDGLFDATRLFMFCGGAVFSDMNGDARDILDREANARLHEYYTHTFLRDMLHDSPAGEAFTMMLGANMLKERRESFFARATHRIRAISLRHDTVVPTGGIIKALGVAAGKILRELDFPFPYSHQIPFPSDKPIDAPLLNAAFNSVLAPAAAFL